MYDELTSLHQQEHQTLNPMSIFASNKPVQELLQVQSVAESDPPIFREVSTRKLPLVKGTDSISLPSISLECVNSIEPHSDNQLGYSGNEEVRTSITQVRDSKDGNHLISELPIVLLRIRRKILQRDDGKLPQQKLTLCQKIAFQYVDQLIHIDGMETVINHDISKHSKEKLLVDIWDHLLPTIGEYTLQNTTINYSIPSSTRSASAELRFYGLIADIDILKLPPSFYLAFSLLQHESGRGWMAIIQSGQAFYTQTFKSTSPVLKCIKVKLLGLASIIILQTHMFLASYYPTQDDSSATYASFHTLLHRMQPSTIMEGLAFLVDVASTSSHHGEMNTLLSSKAQEAACTLMELVSHSSLSRFSNSFMSKAKPILKLDLDLLRSCYNSLDRLLKLARDLAFPEKYKNNPFLVSDGDVFFKHIPTFMLDELDPRVLCRVALISFWSATIKRTTDITVNSATDKCTVENMLITFHETIASNYYNGPKVGQFTCDLCHINRFPRVRADSLLQTWNESDSNFIVPGDEKTSNASSDLFIKSLCLSLCYKDDTLKLDSKVTLIKLICSFFIKGNRWAMDPLYYIQLSVLNNLIDDMSKFFSSSANHGYAVESLTPLFHEALKMLSTISHITSTCPLLSSCKRKLRALMIQIVNGPSNDFLTIFFSNFDSSDGNIDILLSILKNDMHQWSCIDAKPLLTCFFEALGKSKYFQKIIELDLSFVHIMPVDAVMTGLLDLLTKEETSNEMRKSLPMKLLLQILENSANDNSKLIANNLVSCLMQMERSTNQSTAKSLDALIHTLSECFSINLLITEKFGDHVLGLFLTSLGTKLIENPSERIPISVLSTSLRAIADADVCKVNWNRNRFKLALEAIIELAIAELERVQSLVYETENVFKRLAPLLILRCIPQGRDNWILEEVTRRSVRPNSQEKLSQLIINFIGIDAKWDHCSAHEKRLSAEIAARYLLLTKSSSSSSYCMEDIFTPVFTALENNIQSLNNVDLKDTIKKSKIWIYSICNFVTLDSENRYSVELLKMINFAKDLSNLSINHLLGDCSMDDWIQLKMGCAELISLYMKSQR